MGSPNVLQKSGENLKLEAVMVERIDIERALDDLISNEEGMRFQGLAVALAQRRWPELIACERHNDLGLDAYASSTNSPNGVGKGLACSITATLGKIDSDARRRRNTMGHSQISYLLLHARSRRKQRRTGRTKSAQTTVMS
jgi:hypothetical protein